LFSIPSSLKSTCSFSFYVATLYKASVEYGAGISDRYEHGQWFDPVVIIPFLIFVSASFNLLFF
jgi:hypothetical protein